MRRFLSHLIYLFILILTFPFPRVGNTAEHLQASESGYIFQMRSAENSPLVSDPVATPPEILNDGNSSTLLTVRVSDPDGDLDSVVINLSPIGGGSSQLMYDDGTHGDATTGDGVYSFQATSSTSTPIGLKALTVIAFDQLENTGATCIPLSVINSVTDTVLPQATNLHTVNNSMAGATIMVSHLLVGRSNAIMLQAATGSIIITVKKPNGEIYGTEAMSTAVRTIQISHAEAGIWTVEVLNTTASSESYQVTTAIRCSVGVVVGTAKDAVTQENLIGVELLTDTGGGALSLEGFYAMVAVAGIFTVSASSLGYETQSKSNVTLNPGETVTVDFLLSPVIIPFNVNMIETNITGPPASETPVEITLGVNGQIAPFYRWFAISGLGTSSLGPWERLSDWSASQNMLTWLPNGENRYLVLAHVAATPNSSSFHQAGLIFETEENSSNLIQILSLTTDMAYPQPTGMPVTFHATAAGGVEPLYYKYFYRRGNGVWMEMEGWNMQGDVVWTPTQDGFYTIVVHVSDDNTAVSNPLNQAGLTCIIGR